MFPSIRALLFQITFGIGSLLISATAQETIPDWFLKRTVRYRGSQITIDSVFRARHVYGQYVVVIVDEVSNLGRKPKQLRRDVQMLRSLGSRADRRVNRVKVFYYILVDPPDSLLIREYFRHKKIGRGAAMLDIAHLDANPVVNQWNIAKYPAYVVFNYRRELVYVGSDRNALFRVLSR